MTIEEVQVKLKEYMEEHPIWFKDLAEHIGISVATLNRVHQGKPTKLKILHIVNKYIKENK